MLRRVRVAPFCKFFLTLESGDRALIEHPENIAFDPEPGGTGAFYVMSGKLRLFSTFNAVSGVALARRRET